MLRYFHLVTFAIQFYKMPHRLIGRTAVFGAVGRGSSPRGATNKVLKPLLISRLARVFSLGVSYLCQKKNHAQKKQVIHSLAP